MQDVELLSLRGARPAAWPVRQRVRLHDDHLVGAPGEAAGGEQGRQARPGDDRAPHPNRTGDSGLSAMSDPDTGAARRMRML